MWKTEVILIYLENYSVGRAQEVWDRSWMNLDMHTWLLDMEHSEADGDDSGWYFVDNPEVMIR